jgi:hypothetical protein
MKLIATTLALAALSCEARDYEDHRNRRHVEPCRDATIVTPGPESSNGSHAEECPNRLHRIEVVQGRVLCRCERGEGGSGG